MEDLQRMAIFARVVEDKSFSAAARRLNLSKSLVSKQVTQLEKSVGARLLNRTTRALSLTEAGAALYEHCARIVEELEEAKLSVSRLHSEPRGLLRISVPVAFGRLHIASVLPEFLAAYPDLKVDMVTTDRFVDLAEEGYDVVVRITDQPAPTLVARKLAPVHRRMVATQDYLRGTGFRRRLKTSHTTTVSHIPTSTRRTLGDCLDRTAIFRSLHLATFGLTMTML